MSLEDGEIIDTEVTGTKPEEATEASLVTIERASLAVAPSSASASLTAQMVASIQARYLMAERHPRDVEKVRGSMLEWCKLPRFAKEARYRKPIGRNRYGEMEYIEGLSVRFAEVALGEWGNALVTEMVVLDDAEKRIIRVAVTDLERNIFRDHDVVVEKTVERKHPREGQRVLRSRINSAGQTVHVVEATEDEVNIKASAGISKAYRTLTLRILPPNLTAECEQLIKDTVAEEAKKQPEEARAALVAAFDSKGIPESELIRYLGHPIDTITTEEIVELRALYLAIKDEGLTWKEISDAIRPAAVDGAAPEPTSRAAEIKEMISKKKSELKSK